MVTEFNTFNLLLLRAHCTVTNARSPDETLLPAVQRLPNYFLLHVFAAMATGTSGFGDTLDFLVSETLEKSQVSSGAEQSEGQVYTQKVRRANQHTLAKVGVNAPWAHHLECPRCSPVAWQGMCRGVKQKTTGRGNSVSTRL